MFALEIVRVTLGVLAPISVIVNVDVPFNAMLALFNEPVDVVKLMFVAFKT